MEYTQEEREGIFDDIIEEIIEGRAIRNILKDPGFPSASTFFKWLGETPEWEKRYAYACALRADLIFEKMLEVAENTELGEEVTLDHNGMKVVTKDMTNHRRLKADTYKWVLAKMAPKKYGDKLDITTDGDKIENPTPVWNFIDANKGIKKE